MAISNRGKYESPATSLWNFENYDSDLERLEGDAHVRKWVKRHGVIIPWIDGQRRQRRYVPYFLVEYQDGQKAVIEVKDLGRIDSDDALRKGKAAEMWCKQRGMKYRLETVLPST